MRNKVILYSTITKYKLKKRKVLIHLSIICHNWTQLFLKSIKSFMNNSILNVVKIYLLLYKIKDSVQKSYVFGVVVKSNLNNIYGECSVNSCNRNGESKYNHFVINSPFGLKGK